MKVKNFVNPLDKYDELGYNHPVGCSAAMLVDWDRRNPQDKKYTLIVQGSQERRNAGPWVARR